MDSLNCRACEKARLLRGPLGASRRGRGPRPGDGRVRQTPRLPSPPSTLDPPFRRRKTLSISFSSLSAPIFETKYSVFIIFRDLQDFHASVPLETPKFAKFQISAFLYDFVENVATFFQPFQSFENVDNIAAQM